MQKMQTESVQIPDDIWGVETMDSWQIFRKAQAMYLNLKQATNCLKPLVLLFRPVAERAALHYLQWLSRLGRSDSGMAVLFYGVLKTPVIRNGEGSAKQNMYLIHQASRFLDLKHVLNSQQQHLIILTVPEDEFDLLDLQDHCHIERITTFEEEYNAKKADEIITYFLGGVEKLHPQLDLLLQIMAEAGRAGVTVPLPLVARHVQRESRDLCKQILCEPLSGFISIFNESHPPSALLYFRGRWMAESLSEAIGSHRSDFPHLTALACYADPLLEHDRVFLLNLLLALWIVWRGTDRFAHFTAMHRDKFAACADYWQTAILRNRIGQNKTDDHPFWRDFYSSLHANPT